MNHKPWNPVGISFLGLGLALGVWAAPGPDSPALLQQYVSELRTSPGDQALREKIIRLALTMNPRPPVPAEALRSEGAGEFAFTQAKSPADFEEAAHEYEKALLAAPWAPEDYLRLGEAQEKAGLFKAAAQSYRFYLTAAPEAKNRDRIQKQIDELERPLERQEAFLKKLDKNRYAYKDLKHDQWLILNIRGHKITEGSVDIEQYGSASSRISSSPLTGREFTLPKRSWCGGGFHCDAVGMISEDGQTIVLKRTEPPSEGGREITLTYKLQSKGLFSE
jgi:hypothetical protein